MTPEKLRRGQAIQREIVSLQDALETESSLPLHERAADMMPPEVTERWSAEAAEILRARLAALKAEFEAL